MRSGIVRTRLAVVVSGALVASMLVPVVAAQAVGPSTVNVPTFSYTGSSTTWTVPVGVTSIDLTVVGAQGGLGGADSTPSPPAGGYQGVVSGTLSVTPGQVLTIGVGQGGASGLSRARGSTSSATYTLNAAVGGASPLGYGGGNGGAAGYTGTSGFGGAGGAATVVSTAGSTIVAGGSGGSGGSGQYAATRGRVSSATFTGRTSVTTVGETGITIAYVCQIPGASCDGGGGAGGGGGAQGGAQGGVEFGSGSSNEWFGYGGFPGQNSTGGFAGLSAAYQSYSTNNGGGSVNISYAAGGPSAPTNVAGVAADSSVPLTWTAPTTLGGSAVSDYTVEYALASAPTLWSTFADGTSTATSTTVTGLTNGTAYIFRVTGSNDSGAGLASSNSSPVTPSGPPGAPSITTISPADGALSVAFTTATSVAPVLDYEYQLGGTGPWLSTGSTTSPVVLSGLHNGTTYAVTLRAVNAIGNGPASAPVNGTPVGAPGAPSITSVSTTPGTATVAFTPGYAGGAAITDYQYQLGSGSWVSAGTTSSPIAITGLAAGTTYSIRLRAMTAGSTGAASTASSVTTPDVPSAPSITVTPGDGSLAVAFSPPANNGSAISSYEYQLGSGAWTAASSTSSPIVVTGLTNGTSYGVRLRAVNAVGTGSASVTVNGTPATVPGAPAIVGGTVAGSNAHLSADFTGPADDGGSAITTYQYSTDAGATWRARDAGSTGTPLDIAALSSDGTTPLVNGTEYDVELRAVNAVGAGAASSLATGIAATTASPPTITAVNPGSTTLQVAFTPGGNGGAVVTGYQYQLDGAGPWVGTGSLSGAFAITGLTNGTSYAVTVRAVNGQGNGTPSAALTGTPVTTPAQPSVTGVSRADQSLTLTVSEPDDGGSPVASWQYSTDGGSTWATAAQSSSPLTITRLSTDGTTLIANGTSYPVTVRAVNAIGASIGSPTTTVGPSASPSAPVVTLTPLDEALRVSFPAPADGGSPIAALEYQLGSSGTWTDAGTLVSPFLISGLTNGTSYTVRLRADNAVGPGTSSSPVAATPRTVPDAPTAVTAAVGNAQTVVGWTAPGSNGGSAITSYVASAYPSAASTTATATCTTAGTTCAVTGLTNTTTYYVSVVAANVAGSGVASAPRVAVTPMAPPGAPTLNALTAGNTTLALPYVAGTAGSSAITGYQYQLNAGSWISAGSATSPITVSGLTNGTSYTVALRAVSAVGPGASSGTRTATPYTFPDAPSSVAADGRSASADITWAAPNNNGSAITSYTATAFSAAAAGSQIGTCTTATLACTITGLANGTTYYVSLQATNAAGLSVRSAPRVAVTPSVAPGVVGAVTAVAGNASAQLSWTPGSTGASAVTDYTVWYSSGGAYTQFADGVSTTTSTTVTGLTNGTTYTFEIYPVNGSGTGAVSAPSNAVTPIAPGTVPTLSATTSLAGGFGFTITNYSAGTTYSFAATNGGTATSSAGTVTVTGVAAGGSSAVTVTATKTGETTTSAVANGTALLAGVPPTFSAATRTVSGFSFQISNFVPAATYTITPSAGSAATSGSTVTISGLSAGQTSDVTVGVAQTGYTSASAVMTGAALGAGTVPTFSTPVPTADGFTFTIANYSSSLVYGLVAGNGAAVSSTGASVVVSGLAPGASSLITVTATDPGLTTATATTSGSALLTGTAPTFSTPILTADGFTDTITNYQPLGTYTVSSTAGTVVAITGSLLVYGLAPGQSADVTVSVARSGYTDASAVLTAAALAAGTTPTFSTPVPTTTGFTFVITNYSSSLTYSLVGTNGAVLSRTGATVTVTGLAPGDTSGITVGAMDPGVSLALGTVSGTALLAGVVPTFTTPVGAASSWTAQITNYVPSAGYTATGTQGTVAVSGSTLTVSGLTPAQSSSVTVTVSQSGYANASAAVTGASLAAGEVPGLSTFVPVEFGFTFSITNYQPGLVYTVTGTNSATVTRTGGDVVVSGLADGQQSQITVTATDPGVSVSSAVGTGTAASPASPVPTLSVPSPTADGYTFDITNYDSAGSYQLLVVSGGGSVVRSGAQVTVSGVAGGATSTVLVAVQVNGRPAASSQVTGTAAPVVTPTPSATSTPVVTSTPAPTTAPTVAPTRATATPTVTRTPSPAPAAASTTPAASRTTPSVSPTSVGSAGESAFAGKPARTGSAGSATSGASATVGGTPVTVTSSSSGTGTTFSAARVTMHLSATLDGHEVALSSTGAITVTADGQLSVVVSGFRPGTVAQVWSPNAAALHQSLLIGVNSRAGARFSLPASMRPGMHTVALTGTDDHGDPVTLQVHIMLAAAATHARPGHRAAVPTAVASSAARPPTASAGSAAAATPAPSAAAAVASAGLAAHGDRHSAGWWWFGLGAGGVAGVAGWFFLLAWRRRDDDDEADAARQA